MSYRSKDLFWLEWIATYEKISGGMYSGCPADSVPEKSARRLTRSGLTEFAYPCNPVHKTRLVLTADGRYMAERERSK